jgi:hypothetical protein
MKTNNSVLPLSDVHEIVCLLDEVIAAPSGHLEEKQMLMDKPINFS